MPNQLEKQLGAAIVTFAEQALESHKAVIVSDLQAAGVSAVNKLEPIILKALKSQGILGQLGAATLTPIVSALSASAIVSLGGEANALYSLVDNELHSLGKSLGGN